MSAPRLAYIGGLSRSGSTLLELLLATAPDVVTVGELQILPHELAGRGRPELRCGCGQPVPDCEFWRAVLGRHDPRHQPEPRLDHFRERYDWGHTVRPARLRDFGARLPPRAADLAAVYLANTRAILRAVGDTVADLEGSRPAVVVDASKDPYRATWLARSPSSDVQLIHLVRDPRGAVCSLARDRQAQSRLVTVPRRASAWAFENGLLTRLGRVIGPERYRLVKYEDLVTDPDAIVAELAEFLGVEPLAHASDRYEGLPVHSVAGNPMRSDRRAIRPDRRWEEELSPVERRLVEMITAAGRSRWGYGEPDSIYPPGPGSLPGSRRSARGWV